MKISYIYKTLFSLFLVGILSSCGGMEELVDDYNSTFGKQHANLVVIDDNGTEILSPGDEGFDPSKILRDQYVIDTETLFQVGAPIRCKKWIWSIIDISGNLMRFLPYDTDATGPADTYNKRVIRLYIPFSQLQPGNYRIKIVITGLDDVDYTDSASFIIYEAFECP